MKLRPRRQADVLPPTFTPRSDPSPPHPRGWPLGWVKQVLTFPEEKMLALRGIDATLYVRFLRGCCMSCSTPPQRRSTRAYPRSSNRVVRSLTYLHHISDPIPHPRRQWRLPSLHGWSFDFCSNGYPEGQVSPLGSHHHHILGLDHLDGDALVDNYWPHADASHQSPCCRRESPQSAQDSV